MKGVSFNHSGSFKNLERFLNEMKTLNVEKILRRYGAQGVAALTASTPVRTGLAAGSWSFETYSTLRSCGISWTNTDIETGFPVAIMLQYGYATGTGGYVQGEDYINPAIRPIFDKIVRDVWKEVTSA